MLKFAIFLLICGSLCLNVCFGVEKQTTIGAANIEDACISDTSANKNYGGNGVIYMIGNARLVIRPMGVAAALGPNATISACCCSLHVLVTNSVGYFNAYRIFKPWVEGTSTGQDVDDGSVTWNDWSCDANEWGKAGCDSANDAGIDNSGDGTSPDRKVKAEGSKVMNITESDVWYAFDISPALAQGWYDGTINEEGIILIGSAGENIDFAACETADATKRPRFSFTYSIPPNQQERFQRWGREVWGNDQW